jgi:hypothetical protein
VKTAGGGAPTLLSSNFDTNVFVFQGCTDESFESLFEASTIYLIMGTVNNPYSKRTSGPISVEIATDDAFTSIVSSTSSLVLLESELAVNAVTLTEPFVTIADE